MTPALSAPRGAGLALLLLLRLRRGEGRPRRMGENGSPSDSTPPCAGHRHRFGSGRVRRSAEPVLLGPPVDGCLDLSLIPYTYPVCHRGECGSARPRPADTGARCRAGGRVRWNTPRPTRPWRHELSARSRRCWAFGPATVYTYRLGLTRVAWAVVVSTRQTVADRRRSRQAPAVRGIGTDGLDNGGPMAGHGWSNPG